MAGGYAASSADSTHKFLLNVVYIPDSVTTAETFLWYRASDRLSLGVAHLYKQNAFRWLASVNLVPETSRTPAVNASAGVQGIGTGNPGYSLTAEKNFPLTRGSFNAFAGIGWRSNEGHSHPVAGFKWSPDGKLSFGLQYDGHATHEFVTYSKDQFVFGLYLIDSKDLGFLVGTRF